MESGRDQLMLLIIVGLYLYLIGCCVVPVGPVGPVGHVGHVGHAKRLFKPPLSWH